MTTARLRIPFFLFALLAIAVVVLLERGAVGTSKVTDRLLPFLITSPDVAFEQGLKVFNLEGVTLPKESNDSLQGLSSQVRGYAIPAMQYVDGILLFTILLMGLALLIPANVHAEIQGIITLIFAIVLILAAVVMIFSVLVKLLLMMALLLSFPFGTIVYLIIYGTFPRGSMNAILGLLFTLKIVFCVLLLLAHQGFLKNIGLVAFIAVSFVSGLVVSFLYGIVPGILVSITDAFAAIVVAVIGMILAIILAIGGFLGILKAVKV
jgi:hypothetical protein